MDGTGRGSLPQDPAFVTSAEALRIEGLRKSFGAEQVLRGIDLNVAPHEVICLIGASGSGKSTLLRCVNLLERIDAGAIWLGGLAHGGRTMLIATHEMSFARDIASRVCFLAEGQIVEQAPPGQLFTEPTDERTRRFLRRIVDAGPV